MSITVIYHALSLTTVTDIVESGVKHLNPPLPHLTPCIFTEENILLTMEINYHDVMLSYEF